MLLVNCVDVKVPANLMFGISCISSESIDSRQELLAIPHFKCNLVEDNGAGGEYILFDHTYDPGYDLEYKQLVYNNQTTRCKRYIFALALKNTIAPGCLLEQQSDFVGMQKLQITYEGFEYPFWYLELVPNMIALQDKLRVALKIGVKSSDAIDRKILQRKTLFVDESDKENSNYLIDQYNRVAFCLQKLKESSSTLQKPFTTPLSVDWKLIQAESLTTHHKVPLSRKNEAKPNNTSQATESTSSAEMIFVFEEKNRRMARYIYHELFDSRDRVIDEKRKKFGLTSDRLRFSGMAIEFDDDLSGIRQVVSSIQERRLGSTGSTGVPFPIIIEDNNYLKSSEKQRKFYYRVKHYLLQNNLACQFLSLDLFQRKDSYPIYAIENIFRQIKNKLGWDRTDSIIAARNHTLFVGVASSSESFKESIDSTSKFLRQSAWVVVTDSAGRFLGSNFAPAATQIDGKGLQTDIESIVRSGVRSVREEYAEVVVMMTYRMSRRDMSIVKETLDSIFKTSDTPVSYLKIDFGHGLMLFDTLESKLHAQRGSYFVYDKSKYLICASGREKSLHWNRRPSKPAMVELVGIDSLLEPGVGGDSSRCIDVLGHVVASCSRQDGLRPYARPLPLQYASAIAKYLVKFSKLELQPLAFASEVAWFI